MPFVQPGHAKFTLFLKYRRPCLGEREAISCLGLFVFRPLGFFLFIIQCENFLDETQSYFFMVCLSVRMLVVPLARWRGWFLPQVTPHFQSPWALQKVYKACLSIHSSFFVLYHKSSPFSQNSHKGKTRIIDLICEGVWGRDKKLSLISAVGYCLQYWDLQFPSFCPEWAHFNLRCW